MSITLNKLLSQGKVLQWSPDLGPRDMPMRRLFITKAFEKWSINLPAKHSRKLRLLSPKAELMNIATEFVAGKKVITFIRRVNPPAGEGIIKLHTTSFRLFGWAPAPQALILARGAWVDETHGPHNKTKELAKQVVHDRKHLGLDDWEKGELYEIFRFEG